MNYKVQWRGINLDFIPVNGYLGLYWFYGSQKLSRAEIMTELAAWSNRIDGGEPAPEVFRGVTS